MKDDEMIILLRECYWAVDKLYPSLAGQVISDPDSQVAMSICIRAYKQPESAISCSVGNQ